MREIDKIPAGKPLPEVKAGAKFVFEVFKGQCIEVELSEPIPAGTFVVTPRKVDRIQYRVDNEVGFTQEYKKGGE